MRSAAPVSCPCAVSCARRSIAARVAWAAVLALPFYLIPTVGKVQNYAPLHTAEVYELSGWAKANTGKEDLFVFPDAGRALHPGIFRVNAQRALYVDWKSGGQVNLLRHFAKGWWDRWQKAGGETYDPSKISRLGEYGIDYFVLKKVNKLADRSPVYENAGYVVYRAR